MTTVVHIVGTDTDIGKSHVLVTLTKQLRGAGKRVWIHKPIACGVWDGETAEDGRTASDLIGDQQDPATVCPLQFPAPISPHLAAAQAGATVLLSELLTNARQLWQAAQTAGIDFLLIEGAGGILSPLTNDGGNQADLVRLIPGITLLVARPDLGTINHTALTAHALRTLARPADGLIINHSREISAQDPATATAPSACVEASQVPLVQEIPYGSEDLLPTVAYLLDQTADVASNGSAKGNTCK